MMKRDALIIGINQYPFLKTNGRAKNLKTPAIDAEKIAIRLQQLGEFHIIRLPEIVTANSRQIDAEGTLNTQTLEDAIIQLFNPIGDNIPDTVLFYFIGHGLRKERGGVTEGFLATSDANPSRNQWGVSLKWLRELLQKSPVKEQIIWLDCCYAGELFNFTEADLGTGNQEQTRFFIAASREYELAEANVFSRNLWQGLEPSNNPEGLVDNDILIAYLKEHLKNAPQQPIFANPNRQILLTGNKGETLFTTSDGDCPYKGLRFFDVADAKYFYGRERLTQQLIEKVQVGKANFLAVLGVSGSGKSSLLRAGLIYQLQQKDRLPQTQLWKISIFTPGENPLENLAMSFLEEEWTDGQRYEELQLVKQAIGRGKTGFADYIKVSQSPRTLLIVDQFEEVFTVCESQKERSHFITMLLGALQQTGDKLYLIFAMRDDFLGKCAAYQELATLIQSNLLMVTPMNEGELRDAIVKPATQTGRKVEPNLIDAILKDLGVESSEGETPEAEPGLLPLLSYTLEQLWYRPTLNWLRLDSYNQLGGVRQTLENLAEETYKDLSKAEQRIADQIFIKLTQLGEETPDTRKQIRMDALISLEESEKSVKSVVQKLADARLIVTHDVSVPDSSQSQQKENLVVIDVAHEVLIRYWGRLQELLDNNREAIRTERKIQTAAEEWRDNQKSKDYLLTGLKLGKAEEFLHNDSKVVTVSDLARELIEKSRKESDRLIEKEKLRRKQTIQRLIAGLVAISVVAGVAIFQWKQAQRQTKLAQLQRDIASIDGLLKREPTKALILAIASISKSKAEFPELITSAESALLNAIQNSRETNVLRGHEDIVTTVAIDSNSNFIFSGSKDGTVRRWNLKNNSVDIIENFENDTVESIALNDNDTIIASANQKGEIRVRNLENNLSCSYQLPEQKQEDNIVHAVNLDFHPINNELISGSSDGNLLLWKLNLAQCEQTKSKSLYKNKYPITAVKLRNDGKFIAFGDTAYSLKLINLSQQNLDSQILLPEEAGYLTTIETIDFKKGSFGSSPLAIGYGIYENHILSNEIENKRISEETFTNFSYDHAQLELFMGQSLDITFRPNSFDGFGYQLALATSDLGDGNNLFLKSTYSGSEISNFSFIGHQGWVTSVSFSSNGNTLISGGSDGTIRLWDSDSYFPKLITPTTQKIKVFDYQGKQLDIGWQNAEHGESEHLQVTKGNFDVYGSDVAVFNPKKNRIFYSSDGKYIAKLSPKNTIEIYNRSNHKKTKKIIIEGRIGFLAISGQSQKIAILKQNQIEIRDFNGKLINKFLYPNSIQDRSFRKTLAYATEKILDISPDGNKIAIVEAQIYNVENNSSLQILDIQGRLIMNFKNKTFAKFIRFNVDGNYILTSPNDYGYFDIYIVHWQPLLKIACNRLKNHTGFHQSDDTQYCPKN